MKPIKKKQTKEDIELQGVFMEFQQKFVSSLRKEAKNLQFTMSQLEILRFVMEKKNPTMKNIADHLSITAPSVTTMIEHLYNKNMVDRVADSKDRRGVRIIPTAKTIKFFSLVKDVKSNVFTKMMGKLNIEDKQSLIKIFKKII